MYPGEQLDNPCLLGGCPSFGASSVAQADAAGLENGHVVFLPHLGLGIAKLDCTKDAADVAKQLETQHPGG